MKMKLLLNSFLVLLIAGCGTEMKRTAYQGTTDALLSPYVKRFESQYNTTVGTVVYFAKLDDPTIGVCRIWASGHTEIEVDRAYYDQNKGDDYAIEELMFHELGHCEFRRAHDSNSRPDGYPESIMYPYAFGAFAHYTWFHAYYIAELPSVMGTLADENFDQADYKEIKN